MAVKFLLLLVLGLQLLCGIENKRFMMSSRSRPIAVPKYNLKMPTLRLPSYESLSTRDHFNYKPLTTLHQFNHKSFENEQNLISQKAIDDVNRLLQYLRDRESGNLHEAENEQFMKSILKVKEAYLSEDPTVRKQNNETWWPANVRFPRLFLVRNVTTENQSNETSTPNSIINPETNKYYLTTTTTTTETVSVSTKQHVRTESSIELKEAAKTFLANLTLSLKASDSFLLTDSNFTWSTTTTTRSVLEKDTTSFVLPAVALNLTSSPHYEENILAMNKGSSHQAMMLVLLISATCLTIS